MYKKEFEVADQGSSSWQAQRTANSRAECCDPRGEWIWERIKGLCEEKMENV